MVSTIGHPLCFSPQKPLELPQEIIDLFVEVTSSFLERKEAQRALAACTLVSRSFGLPARKLLHSTIKITEAPTLNFNTFLSLSHLLKLIKNNPNFTSLIRKFHVDVGQRMQILSAVIISRLLAKIFDALRLYAKNLQIIWITGQREMPISWLKIDPAVLRSFLDLLNSVELRGLRVENVFDLTSDIVWRCPSILSLALVSITWANENKDVSVEAPHLSLQPIRLNELIMNTKGPILIIAEELMRRTISLSNLVRLQISPIYAGIGTSIVWDCAQEAKSSLASLDLMVDPWLESNHLRESSIDIGRWPKLRDLRLHVRTALPTNNPFRTDPFALLHPSTHPTELKSIEVLFVYATTALETLHLPPDADIDNSWSQLKLVNLRQKHPHLHMLYVEWDIMLLITNVYFTDIEKANTARSLREEFKSFILPSYGPTSGSTFLEVDVSIS